MVVIVDIIWAYQGEKSINFYFIMVQLRKKGLKYGTPKPSNCTPFLHSLRTKPSGSKYLIIIYSLRV